MGKLDGRVAFITGAARGQGRSHAIRLAEEGADIIAVDICAQLDSVPYPMATPDDLAQTVKAVEGLGRRIVARQADVRDFDALQKAFDEGTAELGPVTIVLANAGIGPGGQIAAQQQWDDVVAVNLTGVWNTGRVAIPSMIENGQGGAIVLTSSTGGLVGVGIPDVGFLGYTAAKHGVIGLMRSWANYLAEFNIRVTSVAPTTVKTPMAADGDREAVVGHAPPALARALENALPVWAVDPVDVSNAIVWLVSDDARYITGTIIPVDAGQLNRR
ncbi:SDR family mycofactocin-dependent oxidoreductase [Parafrankia irregularis]|uniref:SDR family mycofactocin-dependent oxidoreductase n=1 Tax=Parafrankia irregularis TaxID=795642 RepID=A0A0S4QHU2_9ACTN|nr:MULTISPECIES: mycofactocin-coupled SDR family oxidoreductase [Parafrankia]MBE3204045.1 mycofactocin-coupled SDR family oxidoreductase [Parafrankia sp. CH37]CUU55079.1 SDR family mycofactocin-dependent oxidoreductase [Parafrankia irregularis]